MIMYLIFVGSTLSNSGSFGYVGCTYTLTSDSYATYTLYLFQFSLTFYSWPTFPKENNLYSTNGNPSRYDFFCDITYADSTTYCVFTDVVASYIRGIGLIFTFFFLIFLCGFTYYLKMK